MILYFYINMMAKKMTGAYKLLHTIILLITEILDFTFQVIRKVILPTSRRKGNLLSSLLFSDGSAAALIVEDDHGEKGQSTAVH